MIVALPLIGDARRCFDNTRHALADAIDVARMRSEFAHKTLASDQGLDAAHWSSALSVHGPNLARLLLLPRRFWVAFLPLLAKIADCAELLVVPSSNPANVAADVAALRAELVALRGEVNSLRVERRSA